MSPRRRNRRRERRAIVRLERVNLTVRGRVVGALCYPTFKGRRYFARWLDRAQSPATRTFPLIVGVMEERWHKHLSARCQHPGHIIVVLDYPDQSTSYCLTCQSGGVMNSDAEKAAYEAFRREQDAKPDARRWDHVP